MLYYDYYYYNYDYYYYYYYYYYYDYCYYSPRQGHGERLLPRELRRAESPGREEAR